MVGGLGEFRERHNSPVVSGDRSSTQAEERKWEKHGDRVAFEFHYKGAIEVGVVQSKITVVACGALICSRSSEEEE
ncbi:long-chain-alcohol oxidase [Sarracenia purpurea var. burkii]